jgi:DNA-binding beta-propeller fold protein YncE
MTKVLVSAGVFALLAGVQAQDPLFLVKTIDLPQVEGRIDHLAVDVRNDRLFLAALGNHTVEVLDLQAGTHLRSLKGFHEPQGIALPPDGTIVAVANGQGGNAQFIDRTRFQTTKTVPLGDDPDNVRYDAQTKRLYVGYGAGAIAAIDSQTGERRGEVKLAGHPESFQLETNGPRIYVNVPSAGHIAVLDRQAMKLVTTWAVTEARANYPMALDEAGHRLFIGCRKPAKVLVYDTVTGKGVASSDVVGDTDDLFYDSRRKRLYVSGGDGAIDVFDASRGDRLTRTAHIETAPGARTSLFVADHDRLYLAVPHRGSQKAAVRVYDAR